jgi:isoleucyl-tRNA synthetase
MSTYKDTLNLPKTAFPMKANLAQREPEMLKHWEALDIYKTLREQRQGKKTFILHDGPPYANGQIHVGHALNKILKDIVLKSKSLSGFDAPYVPGWDCHGLPIELNVEKKKGRAGDKISVGDFRIACREYATKQIEIQKASFKRLGVLGEWDNPYLTMNYFYEANVIRALSKVIDNGYVQRSSKPVYWCTACGSALAEAEVEYHDKQSSSIFVNFPVVDVASLLNRCENDEDAVWLEGEDVSFVIWTTTPWTLPANEAVSLHSELDYVVIACEKEGRKLHLVLAKELLNSVVEATGLENVSIVAKTKGEALEGLLLQHPFYDKEVPVILGDHVTTEAGTGCVHTAPGHGPDDYLVGLKYSLPITNPVDGKGCFFSNTPIFAGEHITKANPKIVEHLREVGHLLFDEKLEHSYPHCWRHKLPLLFRATPQWFISLDKNELREKSLNAIKNTKWIPAWGEQRISKMLENHPGWCISRQRAWGVPIAIFIHKETQEPHPRTVELMEEIAKRVDLEGVEAWYSLDAKELLGDEASAYEKGTDVLDVWFDSGVTHYCVLDARKQLHSPADFYLEGSDQHRGWFQTSLLTSVAMKGEAPYKQVLTHGFALDGEGRKMSKSLGNVVEPEKIMKTLGADILRLWVASTDYRSEISISDEVLKRVSDAYRRLRNTSRFLLANLHDFDPKKNQVAPNDMLALDRWVVEQAQSLQNEVLALYDSYEFHLIYQKFHHFCSEILGSFYLDVIKDRQYTCQPDSVARRSAQTAIYHVLEAMARWFAPILSFTADELWKNIPGERSQSVLLEEWYDVFPVFAQAGFSDDDWARAIAVREVVNKAIEDLRAKGVLGSSLEAEVSLYADEVLYESLSKMKDELKFILITSKANLKPLSEAPESSHAATLEGLRLDVNAATFEKCERCWHRVESVGQDDKHPTLCSRCIVNVDGQGEKRVIA